MLQMPRKIDISHKTIFFLTGFLALLWAIYLIRDLILLLFVSFIFVSALSPLVHSLTRWRIPKALSIALVYLLVIVALAGILTLGITPLTVQTSSLVQRLTISLTDLFRGLPVDQISLKSQLPDLSKNLITVTLDIFTSFITAVLVAVITFYLLLDKEKVEDRFASLFGSKKDKVRNLIKQIEIKLGSWLQGQLILSLIVATLIYIGLTVVGLEFALPLAILAGLLEVVPIVGPILSAVPAILIALISSPVLAAIVAGWYLIVQQTESHVIVPQVMKRAVGLNPLVVIIAIAIGSRLLGVAGALLAVPIAVVIEIITEDYLKS